MMFWIIAAVIAFVATASALVPLMRTRKGQFNNADFDAEIYKARIKEIDHDLEINRISRQEADAAKAEEGRRLIAASHGESEADPHSEITGAGPVSQGFRKLSAAAIVLFIPIASVLVYMATGSPSTPDQSLAARMDIDPERQNITRLLERAEARLVEKPSDGKGWEVLAPVYLRLGRVQDSIDAYRNTIRLLGETPERITSLGEALVIGANGVVSAEAQKLFEKASAQVPGEPKPRFYLALALGQSGQHKEAVATWRQLLKDAPKDSPWVPVAESGLKEQLAKLQAAGGQVESQDGLPGPTNEDVKAADAMSETDRKAMINDMVTNLAEKMREDPTNIKGWQRLIRSYTVLGRTDDALNAIKEARIALPDNGEFLDQLNAAEKMLQSSNSQEGSSQ